MKTSLLLFTVLLITSIIISCSKNNDVLRDPPVDNPVKDSLNDFTVEVIQRSPRNTIIRWTEVKSTKAADTVKYRVTLDNLVVDSNLIRLTDTLKTVLYAMAYTGSVTAYSSSGLSITKPFILKSYSGSLFSASPYTPPYQQFSVSSLFSDNSSVPVYWKKGFNMQGATPTISNDTVFFHTSALFDGVVKLMAMNTRTGDEYWSIPTPQIDLQDHSSLTYSRGYLYASTDSGVLCFDSRNGQRIWKHLRATPFERNIFTTNPIIDGDKIFVATGSNSGTLVALDINTGATIWELYLNNQPAPTPVISGELVILVAGPNVIAVNKNTGTEVWRKNGIADLFVSPILTGSNLVIAGGNNGYLTALNPATGATVWSKEFRFMAGGYSSIATGAGLLYLPESVHISGTNYAKLTALNIQTGKIVWAFQTGFVAARNLIYCDNSLYVGGYGYGLLTAIKYNALSGNQESGLGVVTQTFALEVNGKSYYNYENGNYKPAQ